MGRLNDMHKVKCDLPVTETGQKPIFLFHFNGNIFDLNFFASNLSGSIHLLVLP